MSIITVRRRGCAVVLMNTPGFVHPLLFLPEALQCFGIGPQRFHLIIEMTMLITGFAAGTGVVGAGCAIFVSLLERGGGGGGFCIVKLRDHMSYLDHELLLRYLGVCELNVEFGCQDLMSLEPGWFNTIHGTVVLTIIKDLEDVWLRNHAGQESLFLWSVAVSSAADVYKPDWTGLGRHRGRWLGRYCRLSFTML